MTAVIKSTGRTCHGRTRRTRTEFCTAMLETGHPEDRAKCSPLTGLLPISRTHHALHRCSPPYPPGSSPGQLLIIRRARRAGQCEVARPLKGRDWRSSAQPTSLPDRSASGQRPFLFLPRHPDMSYKKQLIAVPLTQRESRNGARNSKMV